MLVATHCTANLKVTRKWQEDCSSANVLDFPTVSVLFKFCVISNWYIHINMLLPEIYFLLLHDRKKWVAFAVVGISFIMTDVLAILQPCLLASVLTGIAMATVHRSTIRFQARYNWVMQITRCLRIPCVPTHGYSMVEKSHNSPRTCEKQDLRKQTSW